MACCLIAGNGIAGITVARLLREREQELKIHIVAQEAYPFYMRPRLIDYLKGELEQEKLFFYPPRWYDERRISVSYRTSVQSVEVKRRRVLLSSGLELGYDFLILATGSKALIPPIPNAHLPGIFTLRTLADAKVIREKASKSRRAVILGGGLLGLEAAHGLRSLNLETVVVERSSRLLPRQLDEEGAKILREILTELGLQIILARAAKSFLGESHVEGLMLENGESIPADLVIVSAGVKPELSYLAESGIPSNFGILVDDRMETQARGVFALGDAAEWRGKNWGIIPPCLEQAPIVVSNIRGEEKFYQGTTLAHTLKVVGTDLTVIGRAMPEGEEGYQVRTYRRNKDYYKLVLQQGHAVGAIALGGGRKFHSKLARYVEERKEISADEAGKILAEEMED